VIETTSWDEDYNWRLLPTVIENSARKNLNRVLYSFLITDKIAESSYDTTHRIYSNAVNPMAWWIEVLSKYDSFLGILNC
jgi:hypothetical protein